MISRKARLLASFCLLAFAASVAWAQPVTKVLCPGVALSQEINTDPAGPLVVSSVAVDLASSQVDVKAAIGEDVVYAEDAVKGREIISALTARRGALVGVNADFFPYTGDPLGMCIIDGELVSEPPGNRAAMGINADKTAFFDTPSLDATLTTAGGASRRIDGINRLRDTGQLILYTDKFGASTRNKFKAVEIVCSSGVLPVRVGTPVKLTVTEIKTDAVDTPIPKGGVILSGGSAVWAFLPESIKVGDTLTAQFNVKSPVGRDWTRVRQAVGGGPWLVQDSKPWIDTIAEGFQAGFASTKHPRTAAGLTANGKLLLVTVDGRQTISGGLSLPDLAALMIRLGAVNAINLDGGGSTTLSVKGFLINSPSEGPERPVADALLIFCQPTACEAPPKLAIDGLPVEVVSGQGAQLQLTCADSTATLTEDQLKGVVWGTTRGIGIVNQSGYFTPVKARKGTVNALFGSQVVSLDVSVVPGPPTKVTAELTPEKENSLRATLKVAAFDMNGNRPAGKEVLLNITGGKSDVESGTTDDKGEFTTGVTWEEGGVDRIVTAVVGDVSAEAKVPGTSP